MKKGTSTPGATLPFPTEIIITIQSHVGLSCTKARHSSVYNSKAEVTLPVSSDGAKCCAIKVIALWVEAFVGTSKSSVINQSKILDSHALMTGGNWYGTTPHPA